MCSTLVDEKISMSSKYTTASFQFNGPNTLFISFWKVPGAAAIPKGIRLKQYCSLFVENAVFIFDDSFN